MFNTSGNVIGDGAAGANVIAFHSQTAVSIGGSSVNNSVRGNRIFQNTGLGIDLDHFGDGVTDNDPGDTDTGANDLQNFPLITNAVVSASDTLVQGTLNSQPNTAYTLDVYGNSDCHSSGHGQGEFYLGSGTATTDGSGNAQFSIVAPMSSPGFVITITATDPNGNTSEFSACQQADINIPPLTFVVTNANDSGPGSLRQALLDASAKPTGGRHSIHFAIATGNTNPIPLFLNTELPTPAYSVDIDGFAQADSHTNSATDSDNAYHRILLQPAPGAPEMLGLVFTNSGNRVRGLDISRFAHGIMLQSSGNEIEGNFIHSNSADGVILDNNIGYNSAANNVIGGPAPDQRNIISETAGMASKSAASFPPEILCRATSSALTLPEFLDYPIPEAACISSARRPM